MKPIGAGLKPDPIMAGIDFDVTKNIIVGVGYKFFGTGTISFASRDSVYGNTAEFEYEYKSHNFILGVSYLF